MPVRGTKPKPDGQKRHRHPPTHEWTSVVDVRYNGKVPPLPQRPGTFERREVPAPARPLGASGRSLWERAWRIAGPDDIDADAVLVVCEQMDERVQLRFRVLRDG